MKLSTGTNSCALSCLPHPSHCDRPCSGDRPSGQRIASVAMKLPKTSPSTPSNTGQSQSSIVIARLAACGSDSDRPRSTLIPNSTRFCVHSGSSPERKAPLIQQMLDATNNAKPQPVIRRPRSSETMRQAMMPLIEADHLRISTSVMFGLS
jgi:hypothetical protein